jgi:DNA-binding MurR/RpiR family transcriptional regulator
MPRKAEQIGQVILDDPNEVINMSITELASRAQVAEGSIISFCRRLGLGGFQALKLKLAREIVPPIQLIQEDLASGDALGVIAGGHSRRAGERASTVAIRPQLGSAVLVNVVAWKASRQRLRFPGDFFLAEAPGFLPRPMDLARAERASA